MKRSTIVWLIIASLCIAVGLVIFGCAMSALDFDFTKLSTVKLETNTYNPIVEFDKISIDVSTADVEFILSDDESCKVICYETEKAKHSVTVEDGVLTISVSDSRKWYDHIGIGFNNPEITLYLPKSDYASLIIDSTTGDVTVPEDFSFTDLQVSANTGDITCSASVSNLIKMKSNTGDIYLEKVNAEQIELSVSTGEIILVNVTAQGKLSVISSTGDIELHGCDGGDIYIKTSTGDIEGTLLSGKDFIADSSTGDVDVPKNTGGARCELKTSTGDIEIEIK